MRPLAIILSCLALAACGGGEVTDRALLTGGPDEFSIIPKEPLVIPETNALPPPGGGNLADRNPRAEAIIALGGRP